MVTRVIFDRSGVLILNLALRAMARVGTGMLIELCFKTVPTCRAIALVRRQTVRAGIPRSLLFGFGMVERDLMKTLNRLKRIRIVLEANVDRTSSDVQLFFFRNLN